MLLFRFFFNANDFVIFLLLMFVNELSIEFLKSYIKRLKLNIIEMIQNKQKS
jgi:hypothetical protein